MFEMSSPVYLDHRGPADLDSFIVGVRLILDVANLNSLVNWSVTSNRLLALSSLCGVSGLLVILNNPITRLIHEQRASLINEYFSHNLLEVLVAFLFLH